MATKKGVKPPINCPRRRELELGANFDCPCVFIKTCSLVKGEKMTTKKEHIYLKHTLQPTANPLQENFELKETKNRHIQLNNVRLQRHRYSTNNLQIHL